jgi:hypothetical protein
MRTRCTRSMVSAALLFAALGGLACAGRQRVDTPTERAGAAETGALQFDNQATTYVDVYLVASQIEWRLGRVPAGMRATLRLPESAIDWSQGFVQVAVIPGSQVSAEAWRDPRAVIAIAQPVSEVLAQRWTFRQPAGAGLQLQATRLNGRP